MSRALTITPAWAWAIVHAGKRIENRSWTTNYRGSILIHADLRERPTDRQDVEAIIGRPLPREIERGAFVARATLVDVVRIDDRWIERSRAQQALGPWAVGPYCWILEDVEPYTWPIKATGRQGLWIPPPR